MGIGGIAIVRVSGKDALSIAKKITKREDFKPRYAHLCSLYDKKNSLVDEAIVIYFKSPNSFTGEDVIEFQTHGGNLISSMIVDEVISLGARIANPGEFTKRAFLNSKIDLTQAEAISSLIEAKSEDAVKLLSKQLKGELRDFVNEIRDILVEVLAFVEVNIDYAEEDLPKDLEEQILNKLHDIKEKLHSTLTASSLREGLIEGFKISIIGKPNVGKSTILNKLLSFERAIVSDIAGTTRDTLEESLRVGTHLVKIVDTAGIRDTKETIEKIGIQRSIKSAKESEIIIAVFDMSLALDKEDEEILNLLKKFRESKSIIVVLNKSDKESKEFDKEKFSDFKTIIFNKNSKIEFIVDELKRVLDNSTSENELILSSKRQVNAVKKAYEAIKVSLENLQINELELFAYNINEAIESISSITYPFERDEILDKMFGNFCLGK